MNPLLYQLVPVIKNLAQTAFANRIHPLHLTKIEQAALHIPYMSSIMHPAT